MIRKHVLACGMAAVLALSAPVLAQVSADTDRDQRIEAWLLKYNDRNVEFVEFPSGMVLKLGRMSRTWGTYIDTGKVFLWNCGNPLRLDAKADADLYLQGKPLGFPDDDMNNVQARYATQCQLKKFSGDTRKHLLRMQAQK